MVHWSLILMQCVVLPQVPIFSSDQAGFINWKVSTWPSVYQMLLYKHAVKISIAAFSLLLLEIIDNDVIDVDDFFTLQYYYYDQRCLISTLL